MVKDKTLTSFISILSKPPVDLIDHHTWTLIYQPQTLSSLAHEHNPIADKETKQNPANHLIQREFKPKDKTPIQPRQTQK